eukprot:jgi/Chrzof1/13293/Cz07g27240.t1
MRIGEYSSRIQDVHFSLHNYTTIYQPKTEVIDEHLKEVLLLSAQKHAELQPSTSLLQRVLTDTPDALTPWFTKYRDEFMRLLRFGEHEAVDHPVACIYFVPSDVAEPVSHVEALKNQLPQPPLMQADLMFPVKDSFFPKYYVLLHDCSGGADEQKVQSNLALLHKSYGASNCSVLRINSAALPTNHSTKSSHSMPAANGVDGSTDAFMHTTAAGAVAGPGAASDAYKHLRHAVLPGGGAGEPDKLPLEPPTGLGSALSAADLQAVAQLLREFAERALLPKLEERMNRLNISISATRKGIRNRLTRLWKTGAGTDGPSQDVSYPWHSVEGQMRQLADLAMLLRHYEFAVSMYRLAAQDFLSAPNNKWYAGVEEMIGLCTILQGPDPGTDPVKYLNRAFDHYSKVPGRQNRMLATRAMLYCAAFQQAAGRHLSANHSLMRAHFDEENARAALLLEQAAYALLRVQLPATRKFAFHIVLAGLRYHSCKQKRLAIHCYLQVIDIYQPQSWRYIEEHLHDILGKQCAEYGDTEGALRHCTALLDCAHRPASAQQHYVDQFLAAVQKVAQTKQGGHLPMDNLPLPHVVTNDVTVHYSDQRCYGNAAAYALPDSTWHRLEGVVTGGSEMPATNWLDAVKQVRDHEEYNTVPVGEEIAVEVTFKNPLQVKLKLSSIRLICEFQPTPANPSNTAGSSSVDSTASNTDVVGDGVDGSSSESAPGVQAAPTSGQVVIPDAKLTLHPGEVLSERLLLQPVATGWLRVTGVSWVVNGGAEGRVMFDIKGRRRKKPKGDRHSQQKHYPPARRLYFRIIPGMPRLELSFDDMPTNAFEGELLRVSVTLKNVGQLPAKHLKVALDHADVALVKAGEPAQEQASVMDALTGRVLDAISPTYARRKPGAAPVLMFPVGHPGLQLEPGGSFTWPMWIYAQQAGTMQFQCVWFCEPQILRSPQMRHRMLRTAHTLQVQPLLKVDLSVSPSNRDLYRYLLRMDVDSNKDGNEVSIKQLSCVTQGSDRGWTIATASTSAPTAAAAGMQGPATAAAATTSSRSVDPGLILSPGETSTQFYHLHCPPHVAGTTSSQQGLLGNVVNQQQQQQQQQPSERFHLFQGPLQYYYKLKGGMLPGASTSSGNDSSAASSRSSAVDGATSTNNVSSSSSSSASGIDMQLAVLPVPAAAKAKAASEVNVAATSSSSGSNDSNGLVLEPPVDVMLMWQVSGNRQQAGAAKGSRIGTVSMYDMCAAQRLNPVRMMLEGPSGTVRHDFRSGSVCTVPLKLHIRNCGTAPVSLVVRAGPDWDSAQESEHAWFAAQLPPTTTSGRITPREGGSPGPAQLQPFQMASGGPGHPVAVSAPPRLGTPPRSNTPTRPSTPIGGGAVPGVADSPSGGMGVLVQAGLPPSTEHVWCGCTCVHISRLGANSINEAALQVCVFRPGVYVLSDYYVEWECAQQGAAGTGGRKVQGNKVGEPFLLKVEAATS